MKKVFFAAIIVAFIVLLIIIFQFSGITGQQILTNPSEPSFNYSLYFCHHDDCLSVIQSEIGNSTIADCALYNFNERLQKASEGKQIRLITDSNYKGDIDFNRKENKSTLMHNKFCILDGKRILTGSFNPSSSKSDRNNMIVIDSKLLAKNYQAEFDEMWNGKFSGGTKTAISEIRLNQTIIENYFCPEDGCADQVMAEISDSRKSVYFMAYSFTHGGIANELIFASERGIQVRGFIDSSSDRKVHELLNAQGINSTIYTAKGILHHKVFIIDSETVITGSFNPTFSGDERNDENLLIIHDKDVAAAFLGEFDDVSSR